MPLRIIQLITENNLRDDVDKRLIDAPICNQWTEKLDDARFRRSVLVQTEQSQTVLDKLHPLINKSKKTTILILPVDASLPTPDCLNQKDVAVEPHKKTITREEIHKELQKNATLTFDYLMLVFFSTLVACIGLLTNNIAALVGAMVIAPFLGPNLALAFGVSTGDTALIRQSAKTNLAGIALTLLITIPIGFFTQHISPGTEILDRTYINYTVLVLAFASGAAGVISLTGGASTVLVGVMVAVALLPPAATVGMMLGAGNFPLAIGALELLIANIVCLNLAAKMVFIFKGISGRTWQTQKKAKHAIKIALVFWLSLLILLLIVIYTHQY